MTGTYIALSRRLRPAEENACARVVAAWREAAARLRWHRPRWADAVAPLAEALEAVDGAGGAADTLRALAADFEGRAVGQDRGLPSIFSDECAVVALGALAEIGRAALRPFWLAPSVWDVLAPTVQPPWTPASRVRDPAAFWEKLRARFARYAAKAQHALLVEGPFAIARDVWCGRRGDDGRLVAPLTLPDSLYGSGWVRFGVAYGDGVAAEALAGVLGVWAVAVEAAGATDVSVDLADLAAEVARCADDGANLRIDGPRASLCVGPERPEPAPLRFALWVRPDGGLRMVLGVRLTERVEALVSGEADETETVQEVAAAS